MSYSPVSDAGYGSAGGSPWLDNKQEKFGGEKDVLLQMDELAPLPEHSTPRQSNGRGGNHHSRASSVSALSITIPTVRSPARQGRKTAARPTVNLEPAPSSSTSFWDSNTYWLSLYFFFNLSLTIYNKVALSGFPFPWTLTCIHSASATIGAYTAYKRGYFQRSVGIGTNENLILIAFSSLYTVNIAVSNLSLNMVSIPVHQVIRSITPLFTIAISVALWRKKYCLETYLSMIPITFGIALATYGDYSFTTWGLFMTLFGAFLAAVKGLATNRILVGRLKFHPLDLLLRMSPLAFAQCLVISFISGELGEVYERTFVTGALTKSEWCSLWVNGLIAFGLNLVSFTANKKAGALTISVAANVKQVLTIVLAVVIFNLAINGVNLLGIALTIAGGAFYTYVEYQSKTQRTVPSAMLFPTTQEAAQPLLPPESLYVHDVYEKAKKSPLPRDESQFGNPFDHIVGPMEKQQRERSQSLHKRGQSLATNSIAGFRYPVPPTFAVGPMPTE